MVSDSVSKKFGVEKVSDSASEKFGIEKSIGFGIEQNLVLKNDRILCKKKLISKKVTHWSLWVNSR